MNLQWQFGFLPTMLNSRDAGNNYIREDFMKEFAKKPSFSKGTQNAIIAGKKTSQQELYDKTKTSALFKIIRNNFGIDNEMDGGDSVRLQQGVYKCLASAILGGSGTFTLETAGKETPSLSTTMMLYRTLMAMQ